MIGHRSKLRLMESAVSLLERKDSTQESTSRRLNMSRSKVRRLSHASRSGIDPMEPGRPKYLTKEEENDLVSILHDIQDKEPLTLRVVVREV